MQVRIIELLNLTSPPVLFFLFILLFLIFCFIFLTFINFLSTFFLAISFIKLSCFLSYLPSSSIPSCFLFLWSSPPLSSFLFLNLHLFPLISSSHCNSVPSALYFLMVPSYHIQPLSATPQTCFNRKPHSESWHYSPKYKELIKRNSCKAQLYYLVWQWEPSDGTPITLIWSHPLYFNLQYSVSYTVCPCLNTNFNTSF